MKELSVKQQVYRVIEDFPGIHFRELQRRVHMGTGSLEYSLRQLEKDKLILTHKDKKNTRYFPLGLDEEEQTLLSSLRQDRQRLILLHLLEKPMIHKEVTALLNCSGSTATWHLSQLVDVNIIILEKKQYTVKNAKLARRLLITYQKSFLDVLVDKFVATWEL